MRLVLLGQSLIAHDLRQHDWPGRDALRTLLGSGDACFTDLETALDLPGAGPPTREGQFLHVAPPSVLDCLADLSVNLLCLANNHAWDRGTAGIVATLEAAGARGFTCAGTGRELAAAAAPAFRRTPRGVVALVCCASGKIRAGAAAAADRPGVNELRLELDGTPDAGDTARVVAAIRDGAARADAVIA
jgi:poly-gamma-glutamate synthesis protein (capsule biosynthesis protein)